MISVENRANGAARTQKKEGKVAFRIFLAFSYHVHVHVVSCFRLFAGERGSAARPFLFLTPLADTKRTEGTRH